MADILLEVCVDDAQGLAAALAGGADRIELCAALSLGGLTPTPGLIARAVQAPVPVHAMIRPRAGDFVLDDADLAVMEAEIAAIRAAGLAGVVLGANLPDGRLDLAALGRLAGAARGLDLTLHRAVDLTPDPVQAVHQAVDLGFDRILTSGGTVRAVDGLARLSAMMTAAAGRISIMPGSGIGPDSLPALAHLGCTEIHASCAAPVGGSAAGLAMGFRSGAEKRTDPARVAALKAALRQMAAPVTLR